VRAQRETTKPAHCELAPGGASCGKAPELKVADPWGDSGWGCVDHVDDVLLHVRSVFLADESQAGLRDYLDRPAST
jgi:hypothetical protein